MATDGRDPEFLITERMAYYERSLSSLVLNKLMNVLKIAVKSPDDMDYLYYHTDKFIKELQDSVEDFQLQPLVRNSHAAKQMSISLMSFRLLLLKTRENMPNIIESNDYETLSAPFNALMEQLKNIQDELKEINKVREMIDAYEMKKEQGGFFAKLGLIRKPEYTLEDIQDAEQETKEECFIEIVRLAKKYHQLMVYAEFEKGEIFYENYRHYAIIDGKKHLSMLPRLVVLPEDREKFEPSIVKSAMERNVFAL